MSQPDGANDRDGARHFVDPAGLRLTGVSATRVEGYLEIGPQHHQPQGIVHGGVWSTVVETAASIGALEAAPEGSIAVGVHNSTEFLRPMRTGRVEVVAEPVHQGRTQQLWDVHVRDEAGRLVAVGRVRLQHLELRPD